MFCHFGHFLHSSHPNNPENYNSENRKTASGDVIILNLCNKNHNKMVYAYSDMECNRHIFFVILVHFWSFTPLLTQKIKIWKKCKKTPGDIILLHICTINQGMLLARWSNIYHCLLENFPTPIYKNLLLASFWAYWDFRAHHHLYDLMISLVLQTACSYPENLFNNNNCKIIKSFRRIMSFESYQVSQCR